MTTDAMNKSFRSKVVFVATPTKSVDFDYTGTEQAFVAPADGKYKIELWGAQGGSYNDEYHGSYGGYSSGIIELAQNVVLNIYVGSTNICKEGATGWMSVSYNGGEALMGLRLFLDIMGATL